MSKLDKLKQCSTIDDLAQILGYSTKSLAFILYKTPVELRYKVFSIPKKTGGERTISAPNERLKLLQNRLACLLYDCSEELRLSRVVNKRTLPNLSHGFERNFSIITNADTHKNRRYILNFDLENFFPSINFGRVRGYFQKSNDFKLNDKVSTLIAQIACHENQLPQGSPCSPVISNLIARVLDVRLVKIAKQYGCKYSRYADDISISSNLKEFPVEIGFYDSDGKCVVGSVLEKEVIGSGFLIKKEKTRLYHKAKRQVVTGLVANKGPNVKSEYYRNARAMCHSLFTKGSFFNFKTPTEQGSIKQLEGILGHIQYVKNFRFKQQGKIQPNSSFTLMLENFLRYKFFFALSSPLIVCEGKTDYIYLKCAMLRLKENNPDLVDIVNSKPTLKVSIFSTEKKSHSILKLDGGADKFSHFITTYSKKMNRFKGEGMAHPVIVLLDNDDGAKGVFSTIKKLTKSKTDISRDKEFYFIANNLYVVPTPLIKGSDSKMEDFFEKELLNTIVDDKYFELRETQIEGKHSYNKAFFAREVIKSRYKSINFDRFQIILSALQAVIKDYSVRKMPQK